MTSDEAVVAMVKALEELQIPCMLVGSFSSNALGVARATHDADFVVHLEGSSFAALAERLGPQFHLDPQLSFETITGTTRAIFKLTDNAFKIELFLLSDDPHDQERFRRRRRYRLLDTEVSLPTAEDVIVVKLRWALRGRRQKDSDDIRNLIAVQGSQIDWEYVNYWCDQHGTGELLAVLRREVPLL